MTLKEELEKAVSSGFADQWEIREGEKVPDLSDVGLEGNTGVRIEATVLYADLADSTGLVQNKYDWFAAEVYKTYLYCAGKIIRHYGGTITAYDGDRVMAVFYGAYKNTSAAKCALFIQGAVTQILQPALNTTYDTEANPSSGFTIKQKVGIDTSTLLVARTGVRGGNDLVWVGNAANRAAKMAALPADAYTTYISAEVYSKLADESKLNLKGDTDMWVDPWCKGARISNVRHELVKISLKLVRRSRYLIAGRGALKNPSRLCFGGCTWRSSGRLTSCRTNTASASLRSDGGWSRRVSRSAPGGRVATSGSWLHRRRRSWRSWVGRCPRRRSRKKLRVSDGTVLRWFAEAGVPPPAPSLKNRPRGSLTAVERPGADVLAQLYTVEGLSIAAVADRLGVGKSAAHS